MWNVALDTPPLVSDLEARAKFHRVKTRMGTVAWREFGSGPPLVLLHGGHGSWLHWVKNIEALAVRHRVLLPDLPGYGDSDGPVAAALDSLVLQLSLSLDALIEPGDLVSLAGFSFGGLVAADLAVARRDVERLLVLGPAGHGGQRRPRGDLRNWKPAAASADMALLEEVMRHNLLAHMLHSPDAVDRLALFVHTQSCVMTRFRSKDISRSAVLPALLASFTGPVLAAWGEHDVTAEPRAAILSLALPRANPASLTSQVIRDAGHWVQFEASGVVNDILLNWARDR